MAVSGGCVKAESDKVFFPPRYNSSYFKTIGTIEYSAGLVFVTPLTILADKKVWKTRTQVTEQPITCYRHSDSPLLDLYPENCYPFTAVE
jgi:hypothetical protein